MRYFPSRCRTRSRGPCGRRRRKRGAPSSFRCGQGRVRGWFGGFPRLSSCRGSSRKRTPPSADSRPLCDNRRASGSESQAGPPGSGGLRMRRLAVPLLAVLAAACASSKASSPPANGAPSPAREAQTQSETHAQPQPAAPAPAKAQGGAHGDLASLAERYLSGLFRAKPHLADYMGDHRFVTGHWDLSTSAVRFRISELTEHGKELAALDRSKMSRDEQVDAAIMADAIALELLELEEIREFTWSPRLVDSFTYYDPGEIIAARISHVVHRRWRSRPTSRRKSWSGSPARTSPPRAASCIRCRASSRGRCSAARGCRRKTPRRRNKRSSSGA